MVEQEDPRLSLHNFEHCAHQFIHMKTDDSQSISQLSESASPTMKWWSKETTAIVTGANKGIGFAIVKHFASLGIRVILTARDEAKGMGAVESLLESHGLKVDFHKLDVASADSIMAFASWFKDNFGVWDILVNNAAVSFNDIHDNGVEHAETVIKTNFYGPKLLTETLLTMSRGCRTSSCTITRILNVSSRLGLPNKLKNQNLKMMLMDEENLSEKKIDEMIVQFLGDAKSGRFKSQGWPEIWPDYAVSKLALNAYSKVLAKRYKENVSVNCLCPGFTQTSMTGGKGKHTADSAAKICVKLALLPPLELPTGMFFVRGTPHVYSKL